jgi:RNA polymerase sigma-70 factor (ECF subfamily)
MINNDTTENELRLVRQAKAGDREAFGQLMENHAVRAYRIAFSILQNQSEAEDAVQEAFITAFKSIKKLEKEASFGSWLSRVVTTRVYDLARQKQRGKKIIESETAALKLEIARSSGNPVNGTTDLSLDLREAITKLPDLHRAAVMLRYTEDASTDDIAKVLGRPAGTIRRVLSESYHLLRLYLEGDDTHEV